MQPPKVKEFHSRGKVTNPESPSPSIPYTNLVNSILNYLVFSIISNPYNLASSGSSSSESGASYLVISQPGPSGFILKGSLSSLMASQHVGSLTQYPEFWGKGDEDVEQHWFLCEAI
jgi:hypothetical protein